MAIDKHHSHWQMCSSVATYVFFRCPTWSARQQRTPWFSPWQSPGFPWSLTQSQMTFLSPMSTSCDTVVSYLLDSVSSSSCEWNWQKKHNFKIDFRSLFECWSISSVDDPFMNRSSNRHTMNKEYLSMFPNVSTVSSWIHFYIFMTRWNRNSGLIWDLVIYISEYILFINIFI